MTPASVPPPSQRETARRLKTYLWPQRWGLLGAAAAFVVASATEPLIPLLLQVALDEGFVEQPGFPLWMVPVWSLGRNVARWGAKVS